MDFLRRQLAPISDEAWQEIDDQAVQTLKSLLTARKCLDVVGPYGMDYAGVSTGRLDLVKAKGGESVGYGIRTCRPLLEARVPFSLDIWELDNAARGARDIDLAPLEEAAAKLAAFEEGLLYSGAKEAGLPSLLEISEQKPVSFAPGPEAFLKAVAEGLAQLKTIPIEGPYALVVGPELWMHLSSTVEGRPIRYHLQYILDGPVLLSQFAPQPYLVSQRGGDVELILGQDVSIGYKHHDSQSVELYCTESVTYRVNEPRAVLFFAPA